MKKIAILTLVVVLLFPTAALANSVGFGYGNFTPEGGGDVGTFFIDYTNYRPDYHSNVRFGLGDADGSNYEVEMTDFYFYKEIDVGEGNNYIGLGFKSIYEDNNISGIKVRMSSFAFPIKFKTVQDLDDKTRFIGKAGWFPIGSYTGDTNISSSFDGDFTGSTIELIIERDITQEFAVKAGYIDESYTYGEDEDVGIDEFDSGFDGLYLGGIVKF